MYDYYQPLNLKPESFIGQFILTQDGGQIPKGWKKYDKKQWVLGVLRLPVLVVENGAGQEIGWCVGNPLNHKDPWAEKIIIENLDNSSINMDAVEEFYEQISGRYILILILDEEEKLFLDPYGSLCAVYSLKERKVASTPTFFSKTHDWDKEIIKLRDIPAKDSFYPLGFTPRLGVKRLLPNHYLDLKEWNVNRHWPKSSSDLEVVDDPRESVATIISCLKDSIRIITQRHPIQLPLTAGRDSRTLLACTREFIQDAVFFTFAGKKDTMDVHISSKLAKQLKLNHKIIPFQEASEEEKLSWLYITGHCVSGAIWETHKSLLALESNRVLFNGIIGEVAKAFFWKEGDHESSMFSARELLLRGSFPDYKRFFGEMENWLSELPGFNAFSILDLFYIEQRLSSHSAPQHYGCQVPLFEIAPLNQRRIIKSMMRLPYEYRRRQTLANDICEELWPELLELPFNKFTGYKIYYYKTTSFMEKMKRKTVNASTKLVRQLVK